jgi:hypothetical protein
MPPGAAQAAVRKHCALARRRAEGDPDQPHRQLPESRSGYGAGVAEALRISLAEVEQQ